jgi:hypothetical protein
MKSFYFGYNIFGETIEAFMNSGTDIYNIESDRNLITSVSNLWNTTARRVKKIIRE